MPDQVPDGTAQDVLDWVGNDPGRAQDALDYETCQPTPRTTLVSKLETIAAKPAQEDSTVSETQTAEPVEGEEVELAPAPEPPKIEDMEFNPRDNAVFVGPANVANPDVEIPDDSYDKLAAVPDDEDVEPVTGTPVEFFQVLGSSGAVVLRFDGATVALDANQAIALTKDLKQALGAVTY